PVARRARARRRARLITTIFALASLAVIAWGVVGIVTGGSPLLLITGVTVAVAAAAMLQRMAAVQRRSLARAVPVVVAERAAVAFQDVSLASDRVAWTP